MGEGDTFINALIGAVASVVLGFIPFSPVLGGAIAGYLQGGDSRDGLWVGVYAGLVAGIPVVLGGFALLVFTGFAFIGGGVRAGAGVAVFALFAIGILLAGALYSVGLSAVGGWLGNYVRYETELLD